MKATTMKATEKLKKTSPTASKGDETKIARALELQSTIDSLKSELEGIKVYFADRLDSLKTTKEIITPIGAALLKITNSYSVAPEYVNDLREIFGTTYDSFVSEKTSYGATAGLKKLIINDDYEYIDLVRNAVIIKESTSVQFKPLGNN